MPSSYSKKKAAPVRRPAPPLFCFLPLLRIAVDAPVEVRVVVFLVLRHRQVHICPVNSAAIVVAAGEQVPNVVPLLVWILTSEPAEVAQPLTAAERPERLLPEQQGHTRAISAWICECRRERRHRDTAANHVRACSQRIENR